MIRAFQFLCKLCRTGESADPPRRKPESCEADIKEHLDRMTEVRPVSVARAVLFRTRR